MSNIVENVPNDIANSSAATWGELMAELGGNFDTVDSNGSLLAEAVSILALELIGPALLEGTPSPFLTGETTNTFTLAAGTIAVIPQGSESAYTGAVVVKTAADMTAGATPSATNYVWLKQTSAGVRSLVVTTSATVPDDCVLVGTATVTTAIDSITEESLRTRTWP